MADQNSLSEESDNHKNEDQVKFLSSQIKSSKTKLETLKSQQDKLMQEIKDWSESRKLDEQEVSNLFLS